MRLKTAAPRGIPALSILAAISALGACGSEEGGDLASLAPADAPVYVEGAVRPEGAQADAIAALAEKINDISDPGAEVIEELDSSFQDSGTDLSYAEDVEPWLGTRGAFFLSSLEGVEGGGAPDGAAIVETTDADAANAFVDKAAAEGDSELSDTSYEGVDYKADEEGNAVGIVEDFLVAGTDAGFRAAVDSSSGDSLADSDEFDAEISSVGGEDALLTAYVDPGAALDAAVASGAATSEDAAAARAAAGEAFEQPISLSADATEESVSVDVSAPSTQFNPTGSAELLEAVPAETWFAFGIEDAGAVFKELIGSIEEQGEALGEPTLTPGAISSELESATGLDLEADVLDVIGSLAVYVAGTSEAELQTGIDVAVTDPEKAASALDSLRSLIEGQGGKIGPAPEEADSGFSASFPDGSAEVALTGEELSVSITGADAAEPSGTLADSDLFAEARSTLGDDYEPQTFIGISDLLAFAEASEPSAELDAARPYTEDLTYGILGTRSEDDRTVSRLVIGVE